MAMTFIGGQFSVWFDFVPEDYVSSFKFMRPVVALLFNPISTDRGWGGGAGGQMIQVS